MNANYGLRGFVGDVRQVIPRGLSARYTLSVLMPPFKRLLDDRTFLSGELEKIGSKDDEVRLHSDDEHGFVVIARGVSGRPDSQGESHAPVPHDHGPLWALYGLYEGYGRLQRYVPDSNHDRGNFPGLRLTSDVPARAGAIDGIEPHSMHLPVFPEDSGTVIVVVYAGPLESVVRRGYVASRRAVVKFKGQFPPGA